MANYRKKAEENNTAGRLEFVTGGIRVISTDHSSIHNGEGFSYSLLSTSVASSGTVDLSFTTAADSYVHLKRWKLWTAGAKAKIEIYEVPSVSGGSPVTPRKRNRISSTASVSTLLSGVSVSGTGTLVDDMMAGSGTQQSGGGDGAVDHELVLNPDTEYLIRATNLAATAADIYVWLFWYEEGAGTA